MGFEMLMLIIFYSNLTCPMINFLYSYKSKINFKVNEKRY